MSKERSVDISPLTHSPLPVSPFDDIAEGPGLHVQVGEGTAQIFPVSRVARAELAGDRARVTNLTRIAVEDGTLSAYGETPEYTSALRLDEKSLVFAKTHKAAIEEQIVEAAVEGEITQLAENAASGEGEEADTEAGERERVHLAGRIGYAPKFRETAKGTLVGSFALAVHDEPGQTSWHSVVLFGARAEKLRESGVGKGDEVEVVGYPHEREKRNQKTGETRMVTEIYAAVVKRPKEKDKE